MQADPTRAAAPSRRIDRLAEKRQPGTPRRPKERPRGPARPENAPVFALAVPLLADGHPSYADRSALGAARRLQEWLGPGGAVAALAFAEPAEPLDQWGADLTLLAGPAADDPLGAIRIAAIRAQIERLAPQIVVFPRLPDYQRGLPLGLAAALGDSPALSVIRLIPEERACLCATATPGQLLRLALPRFVELEDGCSEPWLGEIRPGRVERIALPEVPPLATDLGPVEIAAADLALTDAEFVVSAGAGVTDWNLFHRAVAALGATAGASRVVVDRGLMPRRAQVGSSGTIARARVYLGFGISGAPQHLVGIEACDQVIAVNLDPNCPMMRRATLGIVGDAAAIMHALIAALRSAGEGSAA